MEEIKACFRRVTEEDTLIYDYCLGRGFKEEWFEEYKVLKWVPPVTPIKNEDFCATFLSRGERLANCVIFPFFNHRGEFVGFESRNILVKYQTKFKFQDDLVVFGVNSNSFDKIWDGCNIWVVEGIFDLIALKWIIPDLIFSTGTASFSRGFLSLLNRYFNRDYVVNILYDNDKAGIRGSEISVQKLQKINITSRRFFVQDLKDPGDLWDKYGELLIGTLGKDKIK
jgi:hypothetical protein